MKISHLDEKGNIGRIGVKDRMAPKKINTIRKKLCTLYSNNGKDALRVSQKLVRLYP